MQYILLENRRIYIANMLKQGLSVEDIARFFEVPPAAVRASAKFLELEEMAKTNVSARDKIAALLNNRETLIAKQIAQGYTETASLERLGFSQMPKYTTIAQDIANDTYNVHKTIPYYEQLQAGKSLQEIAMEHGVTVTSLNRQLKEMGLSAAKLSKYMKKREQLEQTAQVSELMSCGFKDTQIATYLEMPQNDVDKQMEIAKEHGIRPLGHLQHIEEKLPEMFEKHLSDDEITEVLGISRATVWSYRKKLGLQQTREERRAYFHDKFEDRRALAYRMHTYENKTMQEIADELQVTRATIVSDIRKYEQDHPDEIDDTILWQRRNIAAPLREKQEKKKKEFRQALQNGASMTKALKKSGLNSVTAKRLCQYEQLESKEQKALRERQETIARDIRQGISIATIAQAHGWTESCVRQEVEKLIIACQKELDRAQELQMAYQYPAHKGHGPTTAIMNQTGKDRYSVLDDQYVNSAYLRNHAQAHEKVKQTKGNAEEFLKVQEREE